MSAAPRASLLNMLSALRRMDEHVGQHPLDYQRWAQPQIDYLSRRSRRKLLRTGNRFGKSRVALADVVYRARKAHPHRPDWNARPGPQHQWIVGVSWTELIPHMRVFRSLLGESELKSQPNWTFEKGWGKDSPCLVWPDGSSVTWKTMEQRSRAHAGSEVDHLLIDEPPSSENWRELERRVVSRAGDLSAVLTPVNAPEPLDWLQDLCAEKIVDDMHFPMTEDVFRFVDTGELRTLIDGTVMDAAWIAQQEKEVLPRWRNIVLHGDWNEIVVDGEFSHVFGERHVHDFTLDGSEIFSIGFDHGTKGYSETAVLVAVDMSAEYPAVYVVDTHESGENSTPESDAAGIVAMLGRHRVKGRPFTWSMLKHATGDIPHRGGRGRIGRKSNAELSYEIAKALKLDKHTPLVPPIWTAKSGKGADPRGSTMRGLTWIHKALLRPGQFTIHPRCKSLIESFEKFKGGSEDPHGHIMDGLRYALNPWIVRGQTRASAPATMRVA